MHNIFGNKGNANLSSITQITSNAGESVGKKHIFGWVIN
jgi:hypothetical protein